MKFTSREVVFISHLKLNIVNREFAQMKERRWRVCLIKNDTQNPKISGSHRKMKPMWHKLTPERKHDWKIVLFLLPKRRSWPCWKSYCQIISTVMNPRLPHWLQHPNPNHGHQPQWHADHQFLQHLHHDPDYSEVHGGHQVRIVILFLKNKLGKWWRKW